MLICMRQNHHHQDYLLLLAGDDDQKNATVMCCAESAGISANEKVFLSIYLLHSFSRNATTLFVVNEQLDEKEKNHRHRIDGRPRQCFACRSRSTCNFASCIKHALIIFSCVRRWLIGMMVNGYLCWSWWLWLVCNCISWWHGRLILCSWIGVRVDVAVNDDDDDDWFLLAWFLAWLTDSLIIYYTKAMLSHQHSTIIANITTTKQAKFQMG